MNEIAAALGLEQLRHIDNIVARHRDNGKYYDATLAGIPGLHLLKRRNDSVSGFWTYALCAERRDSLILKLHSYGIGAQRLHLRNDGYSCFAGANRDMPGVAEFDAHNINIPCGWWVSDEERELITECIRSGW